MDYKMVMFLLINSAIYNKKIGLMEEIWLELDWNYVREEARQHNCLAIIFPVIRRIQKKYSCIDQELYDSWKKEIDEMVKMHKTIQKNVQEIADKFNEKNIKVAFFKGEILANLYPVSNYRDAWDIDFLVEVKDEDEVLNILEDLGYGICSECDEKIVFKKDDTLLDMHFSLWKGYDQEKIECLKKLGIEKSDKFIEFNGQKLICNTIDMTKHYEYLICHMVKHFKENGMGVRHLVDLTLLYNKYEKDINIELIRKNMELVGYLEFFKAITCLCVAHLGMKKSALAQEDIIEPNMYDKLLNDIFDSGTFGEKNVRRIKINKMKEKLNNKSWTNRIKNKLKKIKKNNVVDDITDVEKDRLELITMLGL